MCVNFRGGHVTVDDVSKATGYPTGFTSLSAIDLITVAAKFSLPLFHSTNQAIATIHGEIDAGHPVLALINYAKLPSSAKYDQNYTRGHWILIVGYTDTSLIYHDPYWPNATGGAFKTITADAFDVAWATTNSDFGVPRQLLRITTPVSSVKIGLHMAARGGDQTVGDWAAFDAAKLQAIKFLSNHSLNDITAGVHRVGAASVYFRMFADPTDPVMATGASFFNVHRGWFDQLYPLGVVKWEVHNEPNLQVEGLGQWWHSASEFADWYRQCAKLIRKNYPNSKIMWPGLSPQPNVPEYIAQLRLLIGEGLVDLIGVHNYWQNPGTGLYGIDSVDSGGLYYTKFLGLGKPVVITEASNNSPLVDYTTKGDQYIYYSRHIRQGVEAVLFFVSSSSNFAFRSESWSDTPIPAIVGSR